MRKIEQQMIDAINNNQDWQSANTTVHFNEENNVSIVRLHGNKIAEVGDDYLTLFDGDHQTKTTKSRLNAILGEFGYTCGTKREYIFQKQYEWFVNFFNMKSNQIEVVPFVDGMILAAWDDYTERLTLSPYNLHSHSLHSSPMKTVLVIIIGVLLWNNNDARIFTSDALQQASDFIQPNNTNDQTIGERIDSFLN